MVLNYYLNKVHKCIERTIRLAFRCKHSPLFFVFTQLARGVRQGILLCGVLFLYIQCVHAI